MGIMILVFQPIVAFNFHVSSQGLEMGGFQHNLTMVLGKGQTKEMILKIRWNLREAKLMPPADVCSTSALIFFMNIIVWNFSGALKPSFQKYV